MVKFLTKKGLLSLVPFQAVSPDDSEYIVRMPGSLSFFVPVFRDPVPSTHLKRAYLAKLTPNTLCNRKLLTPRSSSGLKPTLVTWIISSACFANVRRIKSTTTIAIVVSGPNFCQRLTSVRAIGVTYILDRQFSKTNSLPPYALLIHVRGAFFSSIPIKSLCNRKMLTPRSSSQVLHGRWTRHSTY
jgi:hypothetical protein